MKFSVHPLKQAVLNTPQWLFTVFLLFALNTVLAAQPSTSEATTLPEEIIVTAPVSLPQLRQEIEAAEVAYFNIFNELNDDDRFDIHCRTKKRPGSKMVYRQCTPNYYETAMEGEADTLLKNVGAVGAIAPEAGRDILPHYNKMLKEKVEEIIAQSPEFVEAVKHFEDLKGQYEEQRALKFDIEID